MSISSRIKPEGETEPEWSYPALGCIRREESFQIVLFGKPGEGTVVYSSAPASLPWRVGTHISWLDMAAFRPWRGDVTISSTP
jgi:hypothetical protein